MFTRGLSYNKLSTAGELYHAQKRDKAMLQKLFSHLKPIYRVRAYYHYLRCLRNLLSWKSFHSIENLKKLQKSFHKVFLLLRFCLFLFSRSHTRFTLSKRQQQETSLPVIQRLKRKKTKPFDLQQMQICPKTFVHG